MKGPVRYVLAKPLLEGEHLLGCADCGALVADGHVAAHDRWHAALVPPAIIKLAGDITPEQLDELAARWKANWERDKNKPPVVLSDPPPGVVWLVRDPATCPATCPGDVLAVFPTHAQASVFRTRLHDQVLVIEKST